ncbi:MAG: DUF4870 domain-containing protein [Cyclobacteriaceae bacterium]|nr:DUF4870 domain-containing protein [Cyclobacteriaceae bacterium]
MDTSYVPGEYENERASNIYLMSLAVIVVGLPLPIINFLATIIVYFSNRNSTYFVRWHSMQALLSQALVASINAVGFSWTMWIIFGPVRLSNEYIAYVITAAVFNLAEFVGTIYAAIQTRKGKHINFWLFGPLSDLICKP